MEWILTGILVICGYLLILKGVLGRTENKGAAPVIAFIVLFLYVCALAGILLLNGYLESPGVTLYVCALVYACFYMIYALCMVLRKKREYQTGPMLVFLAYLLAVLYITIFSRSVESNSGMQMEILRFTDTTSSFNFEQHAIQNIALFVPFGVFLPMLHRDRACGWGTTISMGIMLSVMIETIQLVSKKGVCDVDDLIMNSAGMIIGYFFYYLYDECEKRLKESTI